MVAEKKSVPSGSGRRISMFLALEPATGAKVKRAMCLMISQQE